MSYSGITDEFLKCLEEFIEMTNQILSQLKEELTLMENHHKRCVAAKTGGTVVSVLGASLIAVSILAAPFTGGTSVIVATGVGTVMSTGGGVINLSADIVDMVFSSHKTNKIDEICAKRVSLAQRVSTCFDKINNIAIDLEKLGFEKCDAFGIALCAAKKGIYSRESVIYFDLTF